MAFLFNLVCFDTVLLMIKLTLFSAVQFREVKIFVIQFLDQNILCLVYLWGFLFIFYLFIILYHLFTFGSFIII